MVTLRDELFFSLCTTFEVGKHDVLGKKMKTIGDALSSVLLYIYGKTFFCRLINITSMGRALKPHCYVGYFGLSKEFNYPTTSNNPCSVYYIIL